MIGNSSPLHTTHTPHLSTPSILKVSCGVSGYDSIHRCRPLRAAAAHGWMLR